MLNFIDETTEALRQAAREQINRVCNVLNGLATSEQEADLRLANAMAAAARKRDEAAQIETDALRHHSATLTSIVSSLLDVVKQLDDGQMVSGSTEDTQRRPKIRAVAGE